MRAVALASCLSVLALLIGCGGSGSNDDGAGQLTQQQRDAIDTSFRSIEAILAFGEVFDAIDLTDLMPETARGIAPCPLKTVDREGGQVHISLDYGTGCLDAGNVITGQIALDYTFASQQGSFTFDEFAVNGHPVDGTANFLISSASTFSASGSLDLVVDGEPVEGEYEVARLDGGESLTNASFLIGDNPQYEVELNDVRIDIADNANGLPEDGLMIIGFDADLPGSGSTNVDIEVEFTEDTPVDRTVLVSVNGSDQFEYTLPSNG